ncbi:MAG: HAMP domain-containing histidine kinase [Bacteroidia bacterium]|nr:HAMP domain-containing histidine kinase [Bacteroidia bacterium]
MNIYQKKIRWKLILFVMAVIIGLSSLWYTDYIVTQISVEERAKVELWANGTKYIANNIESDGDFSFLFDIIRNNETVPAILTDQNDNIISDRNLDSAQTNNEEYMKEQLIIMKSQHQPIEIELYEGQKNYIYYKDSFLLTQLKYYPFIQLAVISLFIMVSYFAMSASRIAEQNQVWVGMAKETAHQLGTPLSSLMALLENFKSKIGTDENVEELEKDVNRLELITERFSKIGSAPNLQDENAVEVVENSIRYLKGRTSDTVKFNVISANSEPIYAKINIPLFDWVMENLCKNAIDAINGTGTININISESPKNVFIDVQDSGKGIPKIKVKTIFKPGFTTKARGWGLGLSLAKRIIENYHSGEIYVKESEINKGTTFRIELNR